MTGRESDWYLAKSHKEINTLSCGDEYQYDRFALYKNIWFQLTKQTKKLSVLDCGMIVSISDEHKTREKEY